MAKIGTAHIEIKPVFSEEALAQIAKQIEDAVVEGAQRGAERALRDQALRFGPSAACTTACPRGNHRH